MIAYKLYFEKPNTSKTRKDLWPL